MTSVCQIPADLSNAPGLTLPTKWTRAKFRAIKEVKQGLSVLLREESPSWKVQQLMRVCSVVARVSPKMRQKPSALPAVSVVNTPAERWGHQALLVCIADGVLVCLSLSLLPCCASLVLFQLLHDGKTAHRPPCSEITIRQSLSPVCVLIMQETWPQVCKITFTFLCILRKLRRNVTCLPFLPRDCSLNIKHYLCCLTSVRP